MLYNKDYRFKFNFKGFTFSLNSILVSIKTTSMEKLLPLLFFLFGIFSLYSQDKKPVYSKARIFLSAENTMKKLASLGVETDHGNFKPGQYFISGFSENELNRIKTAGFQYEILVPDVVKDFQERNAKVRAFDPQVDLFADFCDKVKTYKIPKNWKLGDMGGHLRYEEMLEHLDSMKIKYPNLVTTRAQIDTTKTREGRTIWFVKISDNPNTNDPAEPQGMFSAIHHAREPVGMHQLIFFMWYLLENYNSNPEIKLLVDNSELFFVPCLNPDGYIFNQTQEPNGGGMWRKNRRDNGDGTMGVDLNRNYGYNWGYDDFGSSPSSDFETYRGDVGFSEPETRAMKAFCEKHNFKNALNYHTYSNLVIHPWGYENLQTEDSTLFRNLTREMVRENNYRPGTGMEVLNYNSNGSSDDYMYATTPEKSKILAMTPEVGDWFWPTFDQIPGLCLENLHQNLTVVRALHPFAIVKDTSTMFLKAGIFPNSGPYRLRYKINRIGANAASATFTISFKPFGPNATGLTTLSKTYSNLSLQQTIVDSILIQPVISSLSEPKQFNWEVSLSNGTFTTIDTIKHFGGEPYSNASLFDNCDDVTKWTGTWVKITTGQQQGSGYFKQTSGDYPSSMNSYFTRKNAFDLRSASIKAAELSFWTKYGIEKNFDYANISLSIDSGISWINVCTDKTVLSSPFSQQAGADIIIPIWDGFKPKWQKEYLNLNEYVGQKVWIRFLFSSDAASEFEGFGFDNIRVTTNNFLTATRDEILELESDIQLFPNPGQEFIQIFGLQMEENARLSIFNTLGQKVHYASVSESQNEVRISDLKPGVYHIKIQTSFGKMLERKFMVVR